MVIIEKENPLDNISFFHVPKNAGTSIEYWMVKNAGGEAYVGDLRHSNPTELAPMFPDGFGFKFCVVRNPWSRYVSWWKFFVGQNKIAVNFDEYMDNLMEGWDSAVKYMRPPGDQINTLLLCNFALSYDSLESAFEVIQERTGCYEPLGWENKGKFDGEYVDFFKQQKHIDWVADRHVRDIEGLGYSFGKPRDETLNRLDIEVVSEGLTYAQKRKMGWV